MHEITTVYFFAGQDGPAALILLFAALLLFVVGKHAGRPMAKFWLPFSCFGDDAAGARKAMLVVAGLAGLVSLTISALVFRFFPLSIDEKMVFFDADIFAHGVLAAPMPEAFKPIWETFIRLYIKMTPDHSLFHSMYLPLNALLHMPFIAMGLPSLVDAAMVTGTIIVTYDIGRKLLPDQPAAALFAALMLATSPQILLTGATVYAMTAHLFIDMLWLRAMMSARPVMWLGAAVLALIASGLHQWAYFPFFAVGFLWVWFRQRDWARVAAAALPAAMGVLIWSRYRHYSLPDFWSGAVLPADDKSLLMERAGAFGSMLAPSIALILEHLTAPNEPGHQASMMPYNLFRFLVWQNPLMWLAVLLGYPLWTRVAVLRGVMLSMLAMTLVATFFVPFQGHGWGYRYLHHFLGGLSLCAAFGFVRIKQDYSKLSLIWQMMLGRVRMWCLVTLCAVLPFLLAVSGFYNWVYWKIDRDVSMINADFVILDMIDFPYQFDLIQNDAYLRNRPLRLLYPNIKWDDVSTICAMGTIHIHRPKAFLDSSDALRRIQLSDKIYQLVDARYWQGQGCRVVDTEGKPMTP